MKILNRKQFIELPSGTVYMEYEPCIFGDLCIKEENTTGYIDFYTNSITNTIDSKSSEDMHKILIESEANQSSLVMDFDNICRDGSFDKDQLFAVYEQKDIDGLISALKNCKGI